MAATLSGFLKELYRITYQQRGLVVGFNLPFDFARLAARWGVSKSKRSAGGWSLTPWIYRDEIGRIQRNPFRPNLTIKKSGPRRNFQAFTNCKRDDDATASWKGEFLDLGTFAFALTSRNYSLASALKTFCGEELDKDVEHGIITPEYIGYARNDVKATVKLAKALVGIFDLHPVSRAAGGRLSETQCYSPASLAKAYLEAAGFRAPEIPEDKYGPCFAAFYGGWAEVPLVGKPPVQLLDFKKMYQTQFILQGIQELLASTQLVFEDRTAEVIEFVQGITRNQLFDKSIWQKFKVLCWIVAEDEILITKALFDGKNFSTGMVPRTSNGRPVPYYLADVILAKLLTGRAPRIVGAECIRGVGEARLQPVAFPGGALFDPSAGDNFFKFNVEEGEKLKRGLGEYAALSKSTRLALAPGIKALGNSGAFGIFAETNERDLPGEQKEWVDLLGDGDQLRVHLKHPEEPGRFFCPPLAGLITAGARLMLGLAHSLVRHAGGTVAFGDTDSLAVVATEDGRDVPIDTTVRQYERELISLKSLSWAEIQEIVVQFEALNPYDHALIPGSILEIKEVNYRDDAMVEIEALTRSAKRYRLKHTDGSIADRKESILGMLLSPLDQAPGDDRRDASTGWIDNAWEVVEEIVERGSSDRAWLNRPAVRRLSVSSPKVMKNLSAFNRGKPREEQIRPFNFYLVATATSTASTGEVVTQSVVAPFERDPAKWARLEWARTDTGQGLVLGQPDENGVAWRLRTVGEFLKQFAEHTSPEWLDCEGRLCNSQTRGVLTRRPIRDGDRYLLTKESLTWVDDDPEHAFETPQPISFRDASRNAGTMRAPTEWTQIILPAIKALGAQEIANRLQLNYRTVKSWTSGQKRPVNFGPVRQAAIGLAMDHGLFSDEEIARHNDTTILSLVPGRVQLAAEFLTHVTAMFLTLRGGMRPLARAMPKTAKPAVETVRRWRDFHTAPKTLADNTAYLRRMAKFARAGLRQLGRRVVTERGPAGDRVVILAYLWGSGGGGVLKLSPAEALSYTRLYFGAAPACDDYPNCPAWGET